MPESLLDADAVALLLNTTPRHLKRLTASGELPYVKVGRKVRFRRTDVTAYVERHTVKP